MSNENMFCGRGFVRWDPENPATRSGGIGGSEIAAACGMSPWQTPYQLWLSKTGRGEKERTHDEIERMAWGKRLESVILDHYRSNWLVPSMIAGDFENTAFLHPTNKIARYTPDGLAVTSDDILCRLVEVKCVGAEYFKYSDAWKDDKIPQHYMAQVQWGLYVLDLECADFVWLVGGNDYHKKLIERDQEMIDRLIDGAATFWLHVINDNPPTVGAGDSETLSDQYPAATEGKAQDFAAFTGPLNDYRAAVLAAKEAEKNFEAATAVIKDILRDAEIGMYQGDVIFTWKNQVANRLDTKAAQAALGAALQPYMKQSVTRVLRFPGSKKL